MSGDPRRWSKFRKAPDREIGKPGENRRKIQPISQLVGPSPQSAKFRLPRDVNRSDHIGSTGTLVPAGQILWDRFTSRGVGTATLRPRVACRYTSTAHLETQWEHGSALPLARLEAP